MNGAESLVRTLLAAGSTPVSPIPAPARCISSPRSTGCRACAACSACSRASRPAAADGYAPHGRQTGGDAAALRAGPGQRPRQSPQRPRARMPLVNIVGDQATYHSRSTRCWPPTRKAGARGVSAWVRTADAAGRGRRLRRRGGAGGARPAGGSGDADPALRRLVERGRHREAAPLPVPPPTAVDGAVDRQRARAAAFARRRALIVLGGAALLAGTRSPMPIASPPGPARRCSAETFYARVERGRGRHAIDRVPYQIDAGARRLRRLPPRHPGRRRRSRRLLRLSRPPVRLRRRMPPSSPSPAPTRTRPRRLPASPKRSAPRAVASARSRPRPEVVRGARPRKALAATLAALMPEDAIVVDESVSFGFGFYAGPMPPPPHDWLHLTGGAIGDRPAARHRRRRRRAPAAASISLQADGSALYTVQALWTQAREQLTSPP